MSQEKASTDDKLLDLLSELGDYSQARIQAAIAAMQVYRQMYPKMNDATIARRSVDLSEALVVELAKRREKQ